MPAPVFIQRNEWYRYCVKTATKQTSPRLELQIFVIDTIYTLIHLQEVTKVVIIFRVVALSRCHAHAFATVRLYENAACLLAVQARSW